MTDATATPALPSPIQPRFRVRRHARRAAHVPMRTMVAASLAMALQVAEAQTWTREASISTGLTATSNGSQSPSGSERSDLIGSIQPALALVGRGANFDLDVQARAAVLAYANGTQTNRVLPTAQAALKATLVERLLFVDSSVGISQVESNAYGGRVSEGSTGNRRTAVSYRISPYVQYDISSRWSLLARHALAETKYRSTEDIDSRSSSTLLRVDSSPAPIGYGLEMSALDSRSGGAVDDRLSIDAFRVRSSALLAGEVIAGVALGTERSEFLSIETTDRIYGLTLQWFPSQRTQLVANIEHRFFGVGGDLSFRHRSPLTSFLLKLNRGPTVTAISAGADLKSFLDAILTTRYPDPAQRAELINDITFSRGLQNVLPAAIDVATGYPQLQTGATATWVLLGRRNSMSFSVYRETRRQLTESGRDSVELPGVISDSRQTGGAVEFNRRLSRVMSLSAVVRRSSIDGLAAREGDHTGDTSLRLGIHQELSLRTGFSAALQHRRVSSNVDAVPSYRETSVFAGLSHRF